MKITKEELLRIAHLFSLKLNDQEAEEFASEIKTILDYTDQLKQVDFTREVESARNTNVFREDIAVKSTSANDIIQQAPKTDGRYFHVPKILD